MSYDTFISECIVTGDTVVKKYRADAFHAQHEISILNKLQGYDGFPQVKDIVTRDDTIEITMNYLGEPIHYMGQHQDAPVRKILVDSLRLLKILHSKNITHGDLKPDNILINDGKMVSIIDFGHSMMDLNDDTRYLTQNLCYRAPELLRKKIINPWDLFKIDIWSLGCVFYELLTDKILFDVDTEKEFLRMIAKNEHLKLMDLFQLKPVDKHLLHHMLEIDPAKRADIDTFIALFTGGVSSV